MQAATLLLRQISPEWFRDGHVFSLAFRLFPEDQGLLSVYEGDQNPSESSWHDYSEKSSCESSLVHWGDTQPPRLVSFRWWPNVEFNCTMLVETIFLQ